MNLICNECGREAQDPKWEGRTCDFRKLDGQYCRGKMERDASEPIPDPHLICSLCGRRADQLSREGAYCQMRTLSYNSCPGILEKVD
jgi:hypothetical protein